MRKKGLKRITVFMMMLLAMTQLPARMTRAEDTFVKTKDNTGLGTGTIANPQKAVNFQSPWVGSYVYYGKYPDSAGDDQPVKYRVLSKDTTDFSEAAEGEEKAHTMLLDCDSVLLDMRFDDGNVNNGQSESHDWAGSDAQRGLNGDSFLTKENVFTDAESAAIASSIKATGEYGSWVLTDKYGFAPLTGEKIFLLDAREVVNSAYGYMNSTTGGTGSGRIKSGGKWWWLRSPEFGMVSTVACVFYEGDVDFIVMSAPEAGVSPAFNLNLSSVLFSSEISSEPGSYKLTVKDKELKIAITENEVISRAGDTITVPYTISGDHADNNTKAVVLITDKEYTDSSAAIKYYGVLGEDGSFKLPSSYQDSWKVYILAENRNGEKETDYASEPMEITIPEEHKHSWSYTASGATITSSCVGNGTCDITDGLTLTISAPSESPLTYDGTVKAASLSTGYNSTPFPDSPYSIVYEKDGNTVSASDVKEAGDYTAKVTIGNATASVDFAIQKADQATPAAPSAEEAQVTSDSVTLKEVDGCQYSMDGQNWQAGPAFTGLTKDTEYTFYQRLKGDDNHNPSPASSVKIRTAKTYTVIYTVTGDSPEGAPTAPKDTNEYEEGSPVSVKEALSMTGYTFSGWSTDDETVTVTNGQFSMPDHAVTFTGSWKINTHTLTVNYQYEDGKEAAGAYTEFLDYAAEYAVDSPAIEGYTASRETVSGKMPDEDVTVDVVYKADEHTITFDTDGGSKINAITQAYGTQIKAPADPKKDGYTFSGWDTEIPKTMPAKDLTIKAKWTKVSEPETEAPETKEQEPETKEPGSETKELEPETKEPEPETKRPEVPETEGPAAPEKEEALVRGSLLVKMTAKGRRSLKLTWKKVKDAEGYDIFFSRCSHGSRIRRCRKVKTIKGNKTFKWVKKGLKKNTSYKAYVRAWVKEDGNKTYISTSPLVHAYTTGGSGDYTAPKSVSVKKKKVTLTAGQTYKIRAKVRKLKKGKKLMPSTHTRKLRYMSTNKKVATVSRSGRIRARAKGSCKIYVYAANGVSKSIKVTVQ